MPDSPPFTVQVSFKCYLPAESFRTLTTRLDFLVDILELPDRIYHVSNYFLSLSLDYQHKEAGDRVCPPAPPAYLVVSTMSGTWEAPSNYLGVTEGRRAWLLQIRKIKYVTIAYVEGCRS